MNVYMNGQEKGDCLINVTSWEGLSACRIALYIYMYTWHLYSYNMSFVLSVLSFLRFTHHH